MLLITGLAQGGAETQLTAIAMHMKAQGWDIEVASLLPATRFVGSLAAEAIPVWTPDMSRKTRVIPGILALFQHLRAKRPQVLCTFMFHANFLGRIAGRLTGVPVIVSSIRNERFGARWREWLEARTRNLADVIVVNSQTVAQSLQRRGIVTDRQTRVIPNWVDFERFGSKRDRTGIRRRLGIGDNQFVWLAVGRLEPQKDYELLLRSIARLKGEIGDFRLLIAGTGPLHNQLQDMLAAQGLSNHVSLLGLRDDVPELMRAADAFVLASRWEGSPNVVLEALATGLPVVATDVGGVSELIENKVLGTVIPPGNADSLAEAMKEMMGLSLTQRQSMAVSGRQRAMERHGADSTLVEWERLFRQLLEQRVSKSTAISQK